MAKRKRRKGAGRRRGAPKRTKDRLTQMSIGCVILLALLLGFLVVPRLLQGGSLF